MVRIHLGSLMSEYKPTLRFDHKDTLLRDIIKDDLKRLGLGLNGTSPIDEKNGQPHADIRGIMKNN
jgi:hypothetical protein